MRAQEAPAQIPGMLGDQRLLQSQADVTSRHGLMSTGSNSISGF